MTEGSNTERQRYVIRGGGKSGKGEMNEATAMKTGDAGGLSGAGSGGCCVVVVSRGWTAVPCAPAPKAARLSAERGFPLPHHPSLSSLLSSLLAFSRVLSISLHTRACPRQDAAQDSDCLGPDRALDVVAIANSVDVPADTAMHGNVELIARSCCLTV